jgi:hypothetical protein
MDTDYGKLTSVEKGGERERERIVRKLQGRDQHDFTSISSYIHIISTVIIIIIIIIIIIMTALQPFVESWPLFPVP